MKPTKAQVRLEAAKGEVARLWRMACLHDCIGTASPFVVFSKDNPYNEAYNAAVKEQFAARKAYLTSQKRRIARAGITAALDSLGMKRVRGALGGHYIE